MSGHVLLATDRLVFINTYQVCWSMHRFISRSSSHVSSRFRGRPRASFTPTSGLSRGRIPLPPPSKSYYISVGTVRARTCAPGFRLRHRCRIRPGESEHCAIYRSQLHHVQFLLFRPISHWTYRCVITCNKITQKMAHKIKFVTGN